jgi:hypothetical protein
MEAIQSTTKATANQVVKNETPATPSNSSTEFDATLTNLLGGTPADKVSEEALFSALVQQRIGQKFGEETQKEFENVLKGQKDLLRKPDGFVPLEDATKSALRSLSAAGKLKAEDVDAIYSEAFAAAQLDNDTSALFDDRGGSGDHTVAVSTLEQALLSSRLKIEKFDAGTETPQKRSVSEASYSLGGTAGASSTLPAGFLYKPVSDSDGKVAVLLPPGLAGLASSVRLVGPTGEELETGRFTGNGNGGRDHFRFSKPGSAYPDGASVEVLLKTGEILRYLIAETSDRQEGGSASSSTNSTPSRSSSEATDQQRESDRNNSSADLSL